MATGTDPFADLLTLQRDMDRMMSRFGGQPRRAGDDGHSFWMPPVDVFKQDDRMVIRVELAGVSPSDISVSVTGNMLTIKGERRQDQRVNESDYVLQESTYGAFERRITMPQDIDASQVRAQYRAGVLEVTIPNSALIAPRPQNVQVAGAPLPAAGGQQQPMTEPQQAPPAATQPGQPQQPMGGQPATQQPGGGQPQCQQPQGYAPQQPQVSAEGGWAPQQQPEAASAPQGPTAPSEQQMGASYEAGPDAGPPDEPQPRRSLFGGWLHGGNER
jgi:HSP20 family protein